jgi:hypothetical protein
MQAEFEAMKKEAADLCVGKRIRKHKFLHLQTMRTQKMEMMVFLVARLSMQTMLTMNNANSTKMQEIHHAE